MGKGAILWFTGLSGAGKSTIGNLVYQRLIENDVSAEVLDGDIVRTNLSKGLGFSREDRDTNIERIAFVANLLAKHGVMVIVAAISPYRETRAKIKKLYRNHEDGSQKFWEIYCNAGISVCKERDPKGLYARALRGEIKNFTGIDDPYEEPLTPDIILKTADLDPEACCKQVLLSFWNNR